jgi:hypothetical protein
MDKRRSESDPNRLNSLPILVSIRVCRKSLQLRDLLTWNSGTILKFDQLASSPLSICVSNQEIGEGTAVNVDSLIGLKLSRMTRH